MQAFLTGLGLCVVFGVLMQFTHIGFFIFPLIFAGILPTIEGFRRMRLNRSSGNSISRELFRQKQKLKKIPPEKQILQIAREEQGKVTPAIIALKSNIPLEKAEKMLNTMAKKGHAVLYVTDTGRMIYEFPDFLPENIRKIES